MRLSESDDREYSQALLDSLIALCAFARNPDFTNLPWLNLRVQLWLRELTRMVGSVEPQPQLLYSQDLTASHELQTLPILHCWDCGATGWGGLRKQSISSKIGCELKDFYQGFFSNNPNLTIVFPDSDSSLKTGWLKWKLCQSCLTLDSTKVEQCVDCGHDHFILVNELGENDRIVTYNNQRKFNRNCPCCQTKSGLVILGSRSASLSSTAIGSLFTSPFNQDRQLLTFSNSVQDAAHRAGFFEARTYRFTFRIALTQFLREFSHLNLAEIAQEFPQYWRKKLGSNSDYVATFIPSDLEWLQEWDNLQNTGQVDPNLVNLINQRLEWEVIAEAGFRTIRGRNLEKTATAAFFVPDTFLDQAVNKLRKILPNEIGGFEKINSQIIKQFLLGLIHHLGQKGGILHPFTKSYIINGGKTFVLQKPLFMQGFAPNSIRPIYLTQGNIPDFETVIKTSGQNSWCQNWAFKCFNYYNCSLD
jgi:DEAD/DEAH box helicase domain-containing protein